MKMKKICSSETGDVRPALEADLHLLPPIEAAADGMFLEVGEVGIELPPGQMSIAELRGAQAVFVIDNPIAGFICLDRLDGMAHLAQIAVLPTRTGEGLGTALIAAGIEWARSRGYSGMILTTYRDVPWNAPYYERRGFHVIPETELTPRLAAVRAHERELGLDDLGPRVAMRIDLER